MTSQDDTTRDLEDAANRLAEAIRECLADGLTIQRVSKLLGITEEEARQFADRDVSEHA